MKKIIKKTGRVFVDLVKQNKGKYFLSPNVLLVDNGYSSFFQLESAIEKIQSFFPENKINIVTFKHRGNKIRKKFDNINVFVAEGKIISRYQIAFKMLSLRNKGFDIITLLSLDVTPVVMSLFCMKRKKIVLFNRYFQWWELRLRKVGESIQYVPKKRTGIRGLLIKTGMRFLYLSHKKESALKHNVLIVDNGYSELSQIEDMIWKTSEVLPNANIYLLPFLKRESYFKEKFNFLKVLPFTKNIFKRYKIAINIIKNNKKFDFILLPSLNITLVLVSLLFIRPGKTVLYNKWGQFWYIKIRDIKHIILFIPKYIIMFFLHLFIFLYLFLVVSLFFLRRLINIIFKLEG